MNILVVGCSMTYGEGLEYNSSDQRLWVNATIRGVFGDDVNVNNISKTGMNNHWIFLETMNELRKNKYDLIIVGWSQIPRYCFHVDVETYSVHTKLNENGDDIESNILGNVSSKWLSKTGDRLRKIHNDFWDTLDLIKYVNVLVDSEHGDKMVFVNTMIYYPKGYFNYKEYSVPSDLSSYEQALLNIPNRNDSEIKSLYDMMHNEYNKYGGIQEDKWLNLYESLRSMQIDNISSTDLHPSYLSQGIFTKKFIPILREKIKK